MNIIYGLQLEMTGRLRNGEIEYFTVWLGGTKGTNVTNFLSKSEYDDLYAAYLSDRLAEREAAIAGETLTAVGYSA